MVAMAASPNASVCSWMAAIFAPAAGGYPTISQGLAKAYPMLAAQDAAQQVISGDKTHFSVIDDSDLRLKLADQDRDTIVAGIEAHVCVLATVADLIQRGYNVIVAADAIDSRDPSHVTLAQNAMMQLGALVLPCELFSSASSAKPVSVIQSPARPHKVII